MFRIRRRVRSAKASLSARNKARTADRPGDEVYLPTKLEWAALELQTFYRDDKDVIVSFVSGSDGKTMMCIMTYRRNVPVGTVKAERDIIQLQVQSYAETRKWPWLVVKFDEMALP